MAGQQSTGIVSRKTTASSGSNSRSSPRTADSPRVGVSAVASEDERDDNMHNSTQQSLVSASGSSVRGGIASSDGLEDRCRKAWHIERPVVEFLRTRIGVLCLLLVSVVVGAITAQSYFHGQPDVAGCAMSYSRPRFVEQTEFDDRWTRFSTKYKLYLYREGGYDASDEAFRIPILFVPGNAGSHKQVRSIASASATAFMELASNNPGAFDRGQIGYDYFTVGLNEELTALHGYSILEQADFINDAIRYILSLYPGTRAKHQLSSKGTTFALPTSVVVVGHSMGGVVARTAFTLPNHIVGSIQAIFTLSTPHNNPTASLEYYVDKVYSSVNSFWRHGFHNGTLDDVSLVSIAGGNLDSMINSDYTYIGELAPGRNSLSILSTGVDDVWLSLDHQSILWCAQMAKKFSKMLVRIMDARRPSQLLPLDQRMSIMRRQLSSDWENGANGVAEAPAVKQSSSDDYSYVYVHRDGIARMVPEDLHRLLAQGQASKATRSGSALHLLPVNGASGDSVVQLTYDPRLFAKARNSGLAADYPVVLLGCNGIKAEPNGTDAEVRVACQGIPAPLPTKLPIRRVDDDPEQPLFALHYVEMPVSSIRQFEYVGVQMPAKPGVAGFLHATIAKGVENLEASPSYLRLLRPVDIRTPPTSKSQMGSSARTRIRLDVPESPFFVFRGTLTMRRSTTSSRVMTAAPRFEPIIRQSDGRRFESRFWYDQSTADFAIHGRGAYVPSDVISNAEDSELKSAGQWDGLVVDVWADPDYYTGFELALQINWYSSLNRTIKRYDMALLAMSFVWACLVMLHQLRTWNAGVSLEAKPNSRCRGVATPAFPSCLASIERLIRNGTLAVLLGAAVLTPILQEVVAHLMQNVWSPARLASWNNLFMGDRGSGWVLGLVPALLVIVSLGFVALEAIVLTAICSVASWAVAEVSGRFESTRKHWSRHDVLEAVSEDGRLKPRFVKIPVRPLIATVAFVVFVCTFVPYQFAFLVIYMAQLFTAIRTMGHAYLAAPQSATTLTPQRVLVSEVLRDRARYQLGLLLFWTSSLPYCAPELLVWVRNLSVLWFEDAPSDHNLANMAGYFALRLLASYHIVPRLTFNATERLAPSRTAWWLRIMTYAFFALAVAYAWMYSIRRPYILYSLANAISAWLALVQFAEFPLRLVSSVQRRVLSPAVTPVASPMAAEFPGFARSSTPLATLSASRSDERLDRKLR